MLKQVHPDESPALSPWIYRPFDQPSFQVFRELKLKNLQLQKGHIKNIPIV